MHHGIGHRGEVNWSGGGGGDLVQGEGGDLVLT